MGCSQAKSNEALMQRSVIKVLHVLSKMELQTALASKINAQVKFMNRGNFGVGHGWTIGYGVIWNSITNSFHNQAPPGADNWAIGVK